MYDVAIVGGGPAGCAVALALRRTHPSASVVLLSDDVAMRFKIGESLPPEAARLLRFLDPALPATLKEHLECAGTASAWTSMYLEEREAMMNPFGHGWHLDRAKFDQSLRDAASRAGVQMVQTKASRAARGHDETHWVVECQNINVQCRWLVDASGRKASIARSLGLRTTKQDNLISFYALLSSTSGTTEDRDTRTIIEASPGGWWYTALLPSRQRLVAFHCDADGSNTRAGSVRSRTGFLDELYGQTKHIAALVMKHEYDFSAEFPNPQSTTACSSRLERWEFERFFIPVGDAAMAFDPLSSQGMMTALEMGCVVGNELGRGLAEAGSQPENISSNVAKRYEQFWVEYEQHRQYYYSVRRRFSDDTV